MRQESLSRQLIFGAKVAMLSQAERANAVGAEVREQSLKSYRCDPLAREKKRRVSTHGYFTCQSEKMRRAILLHTGMPQMTEVQNKIINLSFLLCETEA